MKFNELIKLWELLIASSAGGRNKRAENSAGDKMVAGYFVKME